MRKQSGPPHNKLKISNQFQSQPPLSNPFASSPITPITRLTEDNKNFFKSKAKYNQSEQYEQSSCSFVREDNETEKKGNHISNFFSTFKRSKQEDNVSVCQNLLNILNEASSRDRRENSIIQNGDEFLGQALATDREQKKVLELEKLLNSSLLNLSTVSTRSRKIVQFSLSEIVLTDEEEQNNPQKPSQSKIKKQEKQPQKQQKVEQIILKQSKNDNPFLPKTEQNQADITIIEEQPQQHHLIDQDQLPRSKYYSSLNKQRYLAGKYLLASTTKQLCTHIKSTIEKYQHSSSVEQGLERQLLAYIGAMNAYMKGITKECLNHRKIRKSKEEDMRVSTGKKILRYFDKNTQEEIDEIIDRYNRSKVLPKQCRWEIFNDLGKVMKIYEQHEQSLKLVTVKA